MKKSNVIISIIFAVAIVLGSIIYLFIPSKALSSTENKSNNSRQVVIKCTVDGLKAYREVDFQDQKYIGYKNPELFAIQFRNSEIIGKAKERLKEVQDKKIFREIEKTDIVNIRFNNKNATVELEVKEAGTEFDVPVIDTFKVTMNLKKQGDVWLITNIKMVNKYK